MGRLFVDNDVLLKAAHWQLLDDIPAFARTTWEKTSALTSLIYRARRKDRKLFRTDESADALIGCLSQTIELPAPDADVVATLQNAVGLDVGEVAMIAALCACPDAMLLTGDKRALRALAAPEFNDIRKRVQGRILCLEQFLQYVADTRGCVHLVKGIEPHRDLDMAIRCVIGTAAQIDEHSVREGLASYVRNLQTESGGVLGIARNPGQKPGSECTFE
jgi:hypothetical protein